MTLGHTHVDIQQAVEYTHQFLSREEKAGDADFGTGANRGLMGLEGLPWKEHLM